MESGACVGHPPGIINVDEKKHPIGAFVASAFGGNTVAGIATLGKDIAKNPGQAWAALVAGGVSQGVPIPNVPNPAKGVAGQLQDAILAREITLTTINVDTQIAEDAVAGPIGIGKFALDSLIFLGSVGYCAAR